ncbi:MAG: serine hydrolase [Verrucomicrobia bacterium]|nr:serine hydrolase [Verrucomicrobiota bacterium]
MKPIGVCLVTLLLATAAATADPSSAAAYSARHGEISLLVWKDGRTMLSRGKATVQPPNVYSITKSLCAMGAMAAVTKGWLKLDERASDAITEWKGDPRKREITVRQLLDQTSGLNPGYATFYRPNLKDKQAAVARLSSVSKPGTAFAYGPAHYEALELVLARKLKQPPLPWINSVLLQPLGIPTAGWRRDRDGTPYFSAGAHACATQLLAVGQVVRKEGWRWIFPIFSSPVFRDATRGSEANPAYGGGLWNNSRAAQKDAVARDVEEAITKGLGRQEWQRTCLSREAPSDLMAMVGSYGQRVYIVPSQSLIIVRQGRESGFRDPEFLAAYFRPPGKTVKN